MSDAKAKRRRRWGCCCCSAVLLPGLVLVVAYLVTLKTSGERLAAEMARLRRAGEPLTLAACLPKLGPNEDNAAGVYQEAFALTPGLLSNPGSGPVRTDPASQAARARAIVEGSDEYFALLEQASRIPTCVFEKDWSLGPALEFPELARLRQAAQGLAARSEVQRRSGQYDAAAGSCATSLRIAGHAAQSPTLIGYLVSSAVQGTATEELQQVFSSGDPSTATCRALYEEYGKRTGGESFVRALQGERAYGLSALNTIAGGKLFPVPGGDDEFMSELNRLRAVGPLVKPILNQDRVSYLRLFSRNVEAARKPYREAHAETEAVARDVEALSLTTGPITRVMMPVLSRAEWSAFRARAAAGAAQIAAAAKAYRVTHGQYPASLEALGREGWCLPLDVYTGQPYHYRREGRGIAVWSVGPDLRDDGGLNFDPEVHHDLTGTRYDFVFRCSR